MRTMALCANALISLMARGARFLKVTPCSYSNVRQHSVQVSRSQVYVFHVLHHFFPGRRKLRGRTLLCMWMVYSRATTSAMAERPCLPVFLVDDISANRQHFVRAVKNGVFGTSDSAHLMCGGGVVVGGERWAWSLFGR